MVFKYFCLGSPDTISSSAWNLFIMNRALQSILCKQKSVFISCVIMVNDSNRNISLASMHFKCSFRSLFPEECYWTNWETTYTSRRSWKFADVDHLYLSVKIRKLIRLLVHKAFENKLTAISGVATARNVFGCRVSCSVNLNAELTYALSDSW